MSEEILFQRLGGYMGIVKFVEDLMPRVRTDEQLGRFYRNRGIDGIQREQQLLIDFICSAAGGSMYYTGRDMGVVHEGMNIDELDWIRLIDHVQSTMRNLQVPQQERKDLMVFLATLKINIVMG